MPRGPQPAPAGLVVKGYDFFFRDTYNGNGCPCQQQYTAKKSDSLLQRSGNGSRRGIVQRGDDPVMPDFLDHFTGRHIQLEVKTEIC